MSTVTSPARLSRPAKLVSQLPKSRPLSILVVDDGRREELVALVRRTFGPETQIRECDSGLAALDLLRRKRTDVVLIDHVLSDMSGLELVSAVADMADDTAVILMSDRGSGRMAAEAMKSGARDYLDRHDLTGEALEAAVIAALRTTRLEWRSSRMARRLRTDRAQTSRHFHHLTREVQHSVNHLEHSIGELKRLRQETPVRQLVDRFADVEQSLRRSLALLERLSGNPQEAEKPE